MKKHIPILKINKFEGGITYAFAISPLELFQNKTQEERKNLIEFYLDMARKKLYEALEI